MRIASFVPIPCVDRYITIDSPISPGAKVIGKLVGEQPGGVAANFAVAASRLGAHVVAFGWAGTDDASQRCLASLQQEAVDTELIIIRPEVPVYGTTILIDDRGERSVILFPALAPISVDPTWAAGLTNLIPDLCYFARWDPTSAEIGRLLRSSGSLVATTIEATVLGAAGFDWTALAGIDIVFLSHETATRLGWGGAGNMQAPQDWSRGPRTVVVTMGSDGAMYYSTTDAVRAAGFAVRPVDTTGAGDAFGAAFCVYWLEGHRGSDLLMRANAAGALATLAIGSRAGLASRKAIEKLVAGGVTSLGKGA
jgi:ribokinase